MEKDLTIGNSMKILDVLEVVTQTSIQQNDGLLNSKLAYAVKKVKDNIGQLIYKRKSFLDNFSKYLEYQKKVQERTDKYQKEFEIIQATHTIMNKDGSEKKINTKKIQKEVDPIREIYTQDLQKIDEANKEIIEKHHKFLQEKLKPTKEFYKIKIEYLPDFQDSKIIDFLSDYNLVTE
jgi:hypothetical protein